MEAQVLLSRRCLFLLQHLSSSRWHDSSCFRGILALEIIRHLLKRNPFHTLMLIDMINDPKAISPSPASKPKKEETYL
jgi:hypothetical protein